MRYAILKVTPHILMEICKHSSFTTIRVAQNALPEDAKYVRCFLEDSTGWGNIGIVIESESFDDLNEGDLIPVLPTPHFEKQV